MEVRNAVKQSTGVKLVRLSTRVSKWRKSPFKSILLEELYIPALHDPYFSLLFL